MIEIILRDQLLIPFACPKWGIEKISIVGVSTQKTYVQSEVPCVHIDKKSSEAIRLRSINELFPQDFPEGFEIWEAFDFIRTYLQKECHLQTDYERRFLDLYFEYCKEVVTPRPWETDEKAAELPPPRNNPCWVFDALFPLPQAHLYLHDPLQGGYTFVPENMFKVDFAFWTGKQIVAVEIDGESHVGSRSHVRKDRLMQRADVAVIHILNNELHEFGTNVISKLLPHSLTHFWETSNKFSWRTNPFEANIPF